MWHRVVLAGFGGAERDNAFGGTVTAATVPFRGEEDRNVGKTRQTNKKVDRWVRRARRHEMCSIM